MTTLDASSRESCIVRRSRTNTPLQALTLMNDVTFVEASRAMASRVLRERNSDDERLRYAFQLATSRLPSGREQRLLAESLNFHRQRYKSNIAAAEELITQGESAPEDGYSAPELASWTVVMNVLLNLAETVTLE